MDMLATPTVTTQKKTAGRKWVCTQCSSTVIGPERPRANASCRYCLACSGKSTTLVARTCPSLERERTEREERRKARERQQNQRQRERAAAKQAAVDAQQGALLHAAGVDIMKEAARFWRTLKECKTLPESRLDEIRHLPVPKIVAQPQKESVYGTGGKAWSGSQRILLTISPNSDRARILEVLLHELTHCACEPRIVHGKQFQLTLHAAANKLWGVDVGVIPIVPKYALSNMIEDAVRKMITAGAL